LGAINSQAQNVDSHGRIHVILNRRLSDGDPYSYASSSGFHYHYFRDLSGSWHESNTGIAGGQRPKLLFDTDDNAYLVYVDKSGLLKFFVAKASSTWTDWKQAYSYPSSSSGERVCSETVLDPDALIERDTLSAQLQLCAPAGANVSELRVIDVVRSYQ